MGELANQMVLLCSFDDPAHGGAIRTYQCSSDGLLKEINVTPSPSVSFITHHSTKPIVYSVNRVKNGQISAYSYHDSPGNLEFVNTQPTMGTDPCYVSVDASGSVAFVANYTGPSISMYPLATNGSICDVTATIEHQGSSVHEGRQQEPHPHSIRPDPENRVVYVPDLGTDKVYRYTFDPDQTTIEPSDPPFVEQPPGSGPRHLDFHPELPYCYVINELASTITTFAYDPATSQITPFETTSTLPDDFAGHHQAADIHVHPNGEYLYVSNRGHDSIAIFKINQDTGRLTQLGFETTRGEWPRNFVIDPSGSALFVENRHSDSVIGYWIDPDTGFLTPTSQSIEVPEPVCMAFIPEYE